MTWEIVAGIITLAGFVSTIAVAAYKLSGTMAMLETTIRALQDTIREMRESSHRTHSTLFDKVDRHGRELEDHEVRISVLEKGEKK